MLVGYQRRYSIVAEFDPETGLLDIQPRPEGPSSTGGWFDILSGVCIVLYSDSGRLFLVVGKERFNLDETNVEVDWQPEPTPGFSRLTIRAAEQEFDIQYRNGVRHDTNLPYDLTAQKDAEDWDFGLFLANVLSSAVRMEVLKGNR